MALNPTEVKELQHLIKNLLKMWMQCKLAFNKAFSEGAIVKENESTFLKLKAELSRIAKNVQNRLPADLQFGGNDLIDLLKNATSLQLLHSFPQADRIKVLNNWHSVYVKLNRTMGALEVLDEGYYPRLHRHLISGEQPGKKKKRKKAKDGGGAMAMVKSFAPIILILGVVAWVFLKPSNSPDAQLARAAAAEQATADGAFTFYKKAAQANLNAVGMAESSRLEKAIPEEDWTWFQDNYSRISQDLFNVGGAIDPTAAKAIQKIDALKTLISAGSYHDKDEVLEKNEEGNTATYLIAKYDIELSREFALSGEDGRERIEVKIVKIGDTWKVKDFAGGKTKVGS